MSDQDPTLTATAIHDAFLIGWSIQELKSRVLFGALGLQSSSSISSSTPENKQASGGSMVTPPPSILSAVDSLLQASSPGAMQAQGSLSNLNWSITRTSEWRAILIRIASVHDQCFPGSTSENTPYDPSPASPLKSRFPYLYPSSSPDYGLIGIDTSGTVGGNVFDSDQHLGKFKLYDVTRRALNCLNLLYTRPKESLLPDFIYDFQTKIVSSILNHAQAPGTTTPAPLQFVSDQEVTAAVQDGLNQEVAVAVQEYSNETPAVPSPDDLNLAIKFLSFLTVRFLESWGGYLRENFYVGGRLKNNELELLAYEAGHSLSSLSWSISLMTVPLENAPKQDTDLADQLSNIWKKVFNNASINTIQRQISALGPALDDAYYAIKKVQRPEPGERPDPDLPSNVIHTITYSLVYWQRALEWICQQTFSSDASVNATTEQAAIETTTTSETVSTPPVNTTVSTTTTEAAIKKTTTSAKVSTSTSDGAVEPPALTVELSRDLRQALIIQAGIWQTLMLGEQTLRSFTTESVTKKILNQVLGQFENIAQKTLLEPAQNELKRYWIPISVVVIILLVILGGGIFFLASKGQIQSVATVIALLVGSALTFASAGLSRISSTLSPAPNGQSSTSNAATNNTNLDQRLSGLFSLAGEAIATAFQNAYKQILIEFDDLNHYVAISYPLIDFFITISPQLDEEIKDGYIFLTKIIWTSDEEREEIQRVARAAFGPIGSLIDPLTKEANQTASKVEATTIFDPIFRLFRKNKAASAPD